jgi:hypothetical protein
MIHGGRSCRGTHHIQCILYERIDRCSQEENIYANLLLYHLINERDCRSSTAALHVHVLLEDVFLVVMKEMCRLLWLQVHPILNEKSEVTAEPSLL